MMAKDGYFKFLWTLVVAYIYGLGYKKALSFINKKANGKNES